MSGYPSPGPWKAIKKELQRQKRREVIAVVAYVGVGAPSVMPLRRGDLLVCDASQAAIKRRLTSADALARFHRAGVTIFSAPGLHAKVISSPTSAWIGSANASENSRDNLIEASTRITGPEARKLRTWAESLATEDASLSAADLRTLKALPLDPMRTGPSRTVIPSRPPKGLDSLWFLETEPDSSAIGEQLRSSTRQTAMVAARAAGFATALTGLHYFDRPKVKVGDWVIEIASNRVKRPAVVVRIARQGNRYMVWMCLTKTLTAPPVGMLRKVVVGIEPGFDAFRLLGTSDVKRVLNLFN
jgi:hypothetical protein